MHLIDKRSEDYVAPPPPAYIAFSGTASTLGSGTTPAGSGAFQFTSEILADVEIPPVDESQPTTTLQVKTIQGKKIKIRFVLILKGSFL